jgi:hypothetical protein
MGESAALWRETGYQSSEARVERHQRRARRRHTSSKWLWIAEAKLRSSLDFVDVKLSKSQRSLTEELLIGLRAEIVQRRVTATSIVERLDVVEHVCLRLVAGVVYTVMHQFALQRTEEALYCPYRTVLSIGALLYQLPAPFILARLLWSFNNARYFRPVYWLP